MTLCKFTRVRDAALQVVIDARGIALPFSTRKSSDKKGIIIIIVSIIVIVALRVERIDRAGDRRRFNETVR